MSRGDYKQRLFAALQHQAAVALIGPRQVGKTTLARQIADSQPGSLYLDLKAREDQDRLVVLDEIHRVPGLFSSLRGIIDQGRRVRPGVGGS